LDRFRRFNGVSQAKKSSLWQWRHENFNPGSVAGSEFPNVEIVSVATGIDLALMDRYIGPVDIVEIE